MQQPSIEIRKSRQDQIQKQLLLGLLISVFCLVVSFAFDLRIAQNVDSQSLPGDIRTVLNYSEVFAHGYGVAFILLAIWLSTNWNTRQKLKGVFCLLLANGVFVTLIKSTLMRVRPRGGKAVEFESITDSFLGLNPIVHLDFTRLADSNIQSFPSGHASTAFTLAIGLSICFPKAKYVFIVYACVASLQRVCFQAHYLSDICAGAAIAFAMAKWFLATRWGNKTMLGERMPKPTDECDQAV